MQVLYGGSINKAKEQQLQRLCGELIAVTDLADTRAKVGACFNAVPGLLCRSTVLSWQHSTAQHSIAQNDCLHARQSVNQAGAYALLLRAMRAGDWQPWGLLSL